MKRGHPVFSKGKKLFAFIGPVASGKSSMASAFANLFPDVSVAIFDAEDSWTGFVVSTNIRMERFATPDKADVICVTGQDVKSVLRVVSRYKKGRHVFVWNVSVEKRRTA